MEEDGWLPWRVTEPGRGSQGNVSVGCQVKSEIQMVRSWEEGEGA